MAKYSVNYETLTVFELSGPGTEEPEVYDSYIVFETYEDAAKAVINQAFKEIMIATERLYQARLKYGHLERVMKRE